MDRISTSDWQLMSDLVEQTVSIIDEIEATTNNRVAEVIDSTNIEECSQRIAQISTKWRQISEGSSTASKFITHDFRTPEATINDGLFSVKRALNRPEPQFHAVSTSISRIRNALNVMTLNVQGLQFWAEGNLELKECDLADFILSNQSTLKCDNIELSIEAPVPVPVKIHNGTIFLLLSNMLKNARKHGGATEIAIKVYTEEDSAVLLVSDNGHGFNESNSDIKQIFQEGFSTTNSTGLGLAYAPERLKTMGGTIQPIAHGGLKNPYNKSGMQFKIRFPLHS